MPTGFAFSLNPRAWRLGMRDAMDMDEATGRPIVVGRWLCLGPLALCWDYD